MTTNYVLAWLVAITSVRLAWAVWRSPGHRRTSLLTVPGVILGVLGVGLAVDPARAGFAAAACFVVLYVLPVLAGHQAIRLVARQRHGWAKPLIRIAAFLPGYGVRDQLPDSAARRLSGGCCRPPCRPTGSPRPIRPPVGRWRRAWRSSGCGAPASPCSGPRWVDASPCRSHPCPRTISRRGPCSTAWRARCA